MDNHRVLPPDFKVKAVLIALVYLSLALIASTLAYSPPDYAAIAAGRGDLKIIYYSRAPQAIVAVGHNETIIAYDGKPYSISGVYNGCFNGPIAFMASREGDKTVILDFRRGIFRELTFKSSNMTSVACGSILAAVDANSGNILTITGESGEIKVMEIREIEFTPRSYRLTIADDRIIAYAGSIIIVVEDGRGLMFKLSDGMEVEGVEVSGGELIAYGSWEGKGFIYRLNQGEVITLTVPGRSSSVDSLACRDLRCLLTLIPQGYFPVVIEMVNWRYVSDAQVVYLKGFIYHGAGSARLPWISGEMAGIGPTALSIGSTRPAIIGFNETLAAFEVKRVFELKPRLNKIRLWPDKVELRVESSYASAEEAPVNIAGSNVEFRELRPLHSRITITLTLALAGSPLLVYIVRNLLAASNRIEATNSEREAAKDS
ncbi:MAG: hypothetical protein P3X22_002615 [Thermoprotei archaeon]|nr:hypothetical protein [Thermoprotei archaeon]